MAKIKTQQDIDALISLGKRHGEVLQAVCDAVKPGVTTEELNTLTEKLITEKGDTPAFKGYQPQGAPRPYPCGLCTAPNNIVVHGIPTENNYTLKEGDIIGLDSGIQRGTYIIDAGKTVPVGKIDEKAKKLLYVTKEALMRGVMEAREGNTVGDIGHAIESHVRSEGYGVVRELCGHGVGHALHEDPQIPNFGSPGTGEMLEKGMVIAIEPMVNEGSGAVTFLADGYTVETQDGSRSAHFEHNVVITDGDPIILTDI